MTDCMRPVAVDFQERIHDIVMLLHHRFQLVNSEKCRKRTVHKPLPAAVVVSCSAAASLDMRQVARSLPMRPREKQEHPTASSSQWEGSGASGAVLVPSGFPAQMLQAPLHFLGWSDGARWPQRTCAAPASHNTAACCQLCHAARAQTCLLCRRCQHALCASARDSGPSATTASTANRHKGGSYVHATGCARTRLYMHGGTFV